MLQSPLRHWSVQALFLILGPRDWPVRSRLKSSDRGEWIVFRPQKMPRREEGPVKRAAQNNVLTWSEEGWEEGFETRLLREGSLLTVNND